MPAVLPQAPPEMIETIAALVEAQSGLRFVGGRRSELASKTARAFADSGCASWAAYLDDLGRSPTSPMLDRLIRVLTVGETYFFRHRAYFDLLEREIVPRLIAERRQTRKLRIWSAGCATGEEAYSLAIMVRRLLPDAESWDVSILGTDLNTAFLARAREGRYGAWSLRGADAVFTAAYFTPEGGRFRIKPWVAQMVHFAPLNLAEPVYPSPANGTSQLDLIFCRNVLIYLGPELARQVVARLRAALVPGGWLVVGPSDPQPGLLAGFERYGDAHAFAYRRVEEPHASVRTAPSTPLLPPAPPPPAPPIPAPRAAGPGESSRPAAPSRPPRRAHPAAPAPAPIDAPAPPTDASDAAHWVALWEAARAATSEGQLDAAEAACRRAIDARPPRPEPYYLLGVLQQARGDDDAAGAAFRQALYVDRTFVPAILAQATILRQHGHQQRARRALERARRLLEGRPDDEQILAEEPLTVGRLRGVLARALGDEPREPRP
jgi:chemotaxis protein methyltransferase CheR